MTVEDAIDYTACTGPIRRDGRWPPGEGCISVTLARYDCADAAVNWSADPDDWTWHLILSRATAGGTPDLALDSHSYARDGHEIDLEFYATAAEVASIPGGSRDTLHVAVRATHADDTYSYFAVGTAQIAGAPGQL